MNKRKLFVFEFVSGGGFSQTNIPPSLFSEGYGMLRGIIEDFNLLDFEINTILDKRIAYLSILLKADLIRTVGEKDNYLHFFKEIVKKSDYIFIIAPEFSNILFDLTKLVKDLNKTILSIDLKGIQISSSKLKNAHFFQKNLLNTPIAHVIPIKSGIWDLEFIYKKFEEYNKPLVIKPEDGVGAESIFFFETKEKFQTQFESIKSKTNFNRNFILQEFAEGKNLSTSLIRSQKTTINLSGDLSILSVNFQDLNIKRVDGYPEYFGGYTPVEEHEEIVHQLNTLFNKSDFSMFSGYFGIDFIRDYKKEIHFIEINPRLTTSYIGIRQIVNYNIAELIWNSKCDVRSNIDFTNKGTSIFSRLELIYTGSLRQEEEIQKLGIKNLVKAIPEIITPPITFLKFNRNNNMVYSCFIATKTNNLQDSKKRINEIFRIFQKYGFERFKAITKG